MDPSQRPSQALQLCPFTTGMLQLMDSVAGAAPPEGKSCSQGVPVPANYVLPRMRCFQQHISTTHRKLGICFAFAAAVDTNPTDNPTDSNDTEQLLPVGPELQVTVSGTPADVPAAPSTSLLKTTSAEHYANHAVYLQHHDQEDPGCTAENAPLPLAGTNEAAMQSIKDLVSAVDLAAHDSCFGSMEMNASALQGHHLNFDPLPQRHYSQKQYHVSSIAAHSQQVPPAADHQLSAANVLPKIVKANTCADANARAVNAVPLEDAAPHPQQSSTLALHADSPEGPQVGCAPHETSRKEQQAGTLLQHEVDTYYSNTAATDLISAARDPPSEDPGIPDLTVPHQLSNALLAGDESEHVPWCLRVAPCDPCSFKQPDTMSMSPSPETRNRAAPNGDWWTADPCEQKEHRETTGNPPDHLPWQGGAVHKSATDDAGAQLVTLTPATSAEPPCQQLPQEALMTNSMLSKTDLSLDSNAGNTATLHDGEVMMLVIAAWSLHAADTDCPTATSSTDDSLATASLWLQQRAIQCIVSSLAACLLSRLALLQASQLLPCMPDNAAHVGNNAAPVDGKPVDLMTLDASRLYPYCLCGDAFFLFNWTCTMLQHTNADVQHLATDICCSTAELREQELRWCGTPAGSLLVPEGTLTAETMSQYMYLLKTKGGDNVQLLGAMYEDVVKRIARSPQAVFQLCHQMLSSAERRTASAAVPRATATAAEALPAVQYVLHASRYLLLDMVLQQVPEGNLQQVLQWLNGRSAMALLIQDNLSSLASSLYCTHQESQQALRWVGQKQVLLAYACSTVLPQLLLNAQQAFTHGMDNLLKAAEPVVDEFMVHQLASALQAAQQLTNAALALLRSEPLAVLLMRYLARSVWGEFTNFECAPAVRSTLVQLLTLLSTALEAGATLGIVFSGSSLQHCRVMASTQQLGKPSGLDAQYAAVNGQLRELVRLLQRGGLLRALENRAGCGAAVRSPAPSCPYPCDPERSGNVRPPRCQLDVLAAAQAVHITALIRLLTVTSRPSSAAGPHEELLHSAIAAHADRVAYTQDELRQCLKSDAVRAALQATECLLQKRWLHANTRCTACNARSAYIEDSSGAYCSPTCLMLSYRSTLAQTAQHHSNPPIPTPNVPA